MQVFANKANKQCLNGVACLFCHHFHKEKRKRARKARPQRHAVPGVLPSPGHLASPLLYRAPQQNCQPLRGQLLGLSPPYASRAEPKARVSTYSELPALLPTAGPALHTHSSTSTRKLLPPPPPPPPPPPEQKSSGGPGLVSPAPPPKSFAGIRPTLLASDNESRRVVSPPQQHGGQRTLHSACIAAPRAGEELWSAAPSGIVQEARGGNESLACMPRLLSAERDQQHSSDALRAALWPYDANVIPGGWLGGGNCCRPGPPPGTSAESFRFSTALANTTALLNSQLQHMQRHSGLVLDQRGQQYDEENAQSRGTPGALTSFLPLAQSGGSTTVGQPALSAEGTLPLMPITDPPPKSDSKDDMPAEVRGAAPLQLSEPPEGVDEATMGALQRLNRVELLHLMDLIMCTLAIQTPSFCGTAPLRETEGCAPVETRAVPSGSVEERRMTGEAATTLDRSASTM